MKTKETKWIEEEITMAEFAERFLHLNDFNTVVDIDTKHLEVQVLGFNHKTGLDEWKQINSFLVKPTVGTHFTDGLLKGTSNHRVIENNNNIYLKDHSDFKEVLEPMQVVDIEVDEIENYYANGRLNHNTTPGGNAMKFYASVRLRLLGKKMIEIDEEVTKSKVSIGAHVTVRTDKCKLGPPKRAIDFQLLFTEGIYEYDEWITYLENLGYIARSGGWYSFLETFPLKSAIGTKFQKNSFEEILEDADLHDTIRKVIIKAFIRPTNDAQLKTEQAEAEAILE